MKLSEVKLPSNRKFGIFFTAVFIVFSIYSYFQLSQLSVLVFLGLATILLALTVLKPDWLLPMNKLWAIIGLLLGKIVSPIILGAIFFLIFTPIAIITRLIGRDELRLKRRNNDTYWVPRDTGDFNPKSFKDQF
ncbi:uncharacterized protein METZ01_LOCUS157695 [marine metagenome]|uniref:SxtJ n=1 Tax=marine metagenome TaxID=408172 RepID=A0A382AU56_9ZZZZ